MLEKDFDNNVVIFESDTEPLFSISGHDRYVYPNNCQHYIRGGFRLLLTVSETIIFIYLWYFVKQTVLGTIYQVEFIIFNRLADNFYKNYRHFKLMRLSATLTDNFDGYGQLANLNWFLNV